MNGNLELNILFTKIANVILEIVFKRNTTNDKNWLKKLDTYLKDVLSHARKAEVSNTGASRAHTYLANFVCLTEIRRPLHPHDTNHS